MRKQKDIAVAARAAGDDALRRECQANIRALEAQYGRVGGAAGLLSDETRMAVRGFRPVKLASELKNPPKDAIIKGVTKPAGDDVRSICKIDKKIYSCIANDILSDEVILSDERLKHIQDHHPGDFAKYGQYMRAMLEEPDYIVETNREPEKSGLVLKAFESDEHFRLVLRLQTASDETGLKNSVITFQYVREKEYRRIIKNKKVLYKRPDV